MIDKQITQKRQQSLNKTQVTEGDGDPCWDTHKQLGMKKKGNRMVPNCVPKNKVSEELSIERRKRAAEIGAKSSSYKTPLRQ